MPVTEKYTSEPPPVPAGVDLRVYSNPICAYAQRIHLILEAKKIPHDTVHIHLVRKPEWYVKLNPRGQVPFIDHKGKLLPESALIFEYLDDVYGEDKLFGTDPMTRALRKLFVQDFEKKFMLPFIGVSGGNNVDDNITSMVTMLKKLEELLKQNGKFLCGDKPCAADYIIWPHIERLPGVQMGVSKLQEAITKEKFPIFYAWMDRMLADEAVKATSRTPKQHYNFTKIYYMPDVEQVYDFDMKDYTIYAKRKETVKSAV